MELKPGLRLRGVESSPEVVVVRGASSDVDLRCGGEPMVPADEAPPQRDTDTALDGDVPLGKRFFDSETGLEVLCTREGRGVLTVNGRALELKGAKPLPSSD